VRPCTHTRILTPRLQCRDTNLRVCSSTATAATRGLHRKKVFAVHGLELQDLPTPSTLELVNELATVGTRILLMPHTAANSALRKASQEGTTTTSTCSLTNLIARERTSVHSLAVGKSLCARPICHDMTKASTRRTSRTYVRGALLHSPVRTRCAGKQSHTKFDRISLTSHQTPGRWLSSQKPSRCGAHGPTRFLLQRYEALRRMHGYMGRLSMSEAPLNSSWPHDGALHFLEICYGLWKTLCILRGRNTCILALWALMRV
jgi:hypothetical protein